MSGSFMRSFSCKGSGSISVTDQKGSGGSHSGPKPKARFDLRDMTEEEEGLSFAEYFKKRGLHHKLKKLIAKLGRKKKKETRAMSSVVDTEQPAGGGTGGGFEDEFGVEDGGGGGDGTEEEEEEIAPVVSASPMSSSPATPSSLATPSPGGSRRGRKPKYDSQGNPRPSRSLVGRTFFNC